MLLKMKYDEPLSNFAFTFNLRLYTEAPGDVFAQGAVARVASRFAAPRVPAASPLTGEPLPDATQGAISATPLMNIIANVVDPCLSTDCLPRSISRLVHQSREYRHVTSPHTIRPLFGSTLHIFCGNRWVVTSRQSVSD